MTFWAAQNMMTEKQTQPSLPPSLSGGNEAGDETEEAFGEPGTSPESRIRPLSAEERLYLAGVTISAEDPAFYFSWDLRAVDGFCTAATGLAAPPRPPFLPPAPNALDPMSFTTALIAELRTVAGGSMGNALLAPNTMQQGLAISHLLAQIQASPWFQAAAAAYGAALGAPVPPLAITASLADRRPGAAIVPNGLPAPQDQIQLFM